MVVKGLKSCGLKKNSLTLLMEHREWQGVSGWGRVWLRWSGNGVRWSSVVQLFRVVNRGVGLIAIVSGGLGMS